MRRKGPRPVALDHNFPKTVLAPLIDKKLFPGVVFRWIYEVREDLADLADHDLIWELHRIGFSVMATATTGCFVIRVCSSPSNRPA